jgi:soluble lytic murein transglycosylase-like protein
VDAAGNYVVPTTEEQVRDPNWNARYVRNDLGPKPDSGEPKAPTMIPFVDMTKGAGIGDKYGKFASPPQGMIIHHTGGGDNVGQVINTFKDRNVASNFVIGRDGQIYQILPDGSMGQHIMNGWGSQGDGKSNGNMEGVEIIAANDKDVLPVQQQAAANLVAQRAAKYGWNAQKAVFGHGEVNPGHKEPDEGMTVVNGIRNGSLAVPNFSSQYASIQPPGLTDARPNDLALPTPNLHMPVPKEIEPLMNYWADYNNLDRTIFANMIHHESSYNKNAVGANPPEKGGPELGLGQLLPATARDMGLRVDTDQEGRLIPGGVDERNDPNKNLMASAKYLRQMYDNPKAAGDYRKALMLYNSGPGGSFKNPEYADAVLGTQGPRDPVTGEPVATATPGKTAQYQPGPRDPVTGVPIEPPPNALAPQVAKAPVPAPPAEMAQDEMRKMMIWGMLGQILKGSGKAATSGYDPGKVAAAAAPGPPIRGPEMEPVRQMQSPVTGFGRTTVRPIGNKVPQYTTSFGGGGG